MTQRKDTLLASLKQRVLPSVPLDNPSDAGTAMPVELTHRRLPFRQNFSWTLLGNAVYVCTQWGMTVVLGKLGTPQMLGQFALGFAVAAPVIMFTNLQLATVLATDSRHEYSFPEYLSLRVVMTLLALIAILSIAVGTGYSQATLGVVIAIGTAKASESVSDIFYGLFQQRERMDRMAKSMIVKGLLALTSLGITFYLTRSVLWAAAAVAIAWITVLILFDIPNGVELAEAERGRRGRNRERSDIRDVWSATAHVRRLSDLARTALPLGLVMMLISLNTNVPRLFLERYRDESELGIFAALANLIIAGSTVVIALGQSATPRLARHVAERDMSSFHALLLKLCAIGVALGAFGILISTLFGSQLLVLVYDRQYADHSHLLRWIMLAGLLYYVGTFLSYGVAAVRAFSRILIPHLAMTLITVGLSAAVIPSMGLVGAAYIFCVTGLGSCVIPLAILAIEKRRLPRVPTPLQDGM